MRLLLYPFSLIFNIITTIRNWLFDYNILNSTSHTTPIICVGNLSIGGSGKTPHTNYIIDLLKKHYNVAICEPDGNLINKIKKFKPDTIFNALHGQFGEDGYIQTILESQKIKYTGYKRVRIRIGFQLENR